MKVSVLKGFARHAVRLAVLLVFLAGMAGVTHAQAAGASAQSNPKAAAPAATPEKASPGAPAPGASQPKGNHEGITVHGHWTIEVRNPDGTVVTHREFENKLEQPSGGLILANILSGASVSGEFAVLLPVSCVSGINFCVISSTGGDPGGGVIIPSDVSAAFGGAAEVFCSGTGSNPAACPQTLQVSSLGGSVILTGGVVAIAAGSVGAVTTSHATCTNTNITLTSCLQLNNVMEPLTGTLI